MSAAKKSAQPESNQRPRDINCKQLQSPALPTELYADNKQFIPKIGTNPLSSGHLFSNISSTRRDTSFLIENSDSTRKVGPKKHLLTFCLTKKFWSFFFHYTSHKKCYLICKSTRGQIGGTS